MGGGGTDKINGTVSFDRFVPTVCEFRNQESMEMALSIVELGFGKYNRVRCGQKSSVCKCICSWSTTRF